MKRLLFIFELIFFLCIDLLGQSVLKLSSNGIMRLNDNLRSEMICNVPSGKEVEILDKAAQNGYYKVRYLGKTGFINVIYFSGSKVHEKGDISDIIQTYVENKIDKWQQKGEYEKSDSYKERVNEQTRDKMAQIYVSQALDSLEVIYKKEINHKTVSLDKYDADHETYLIVTENYGSFALPVAIDYAQRFKLNWQSVEFKNIDFYVKDNKFYIALFDFYDPLLKISFSYDSKIQNTYSSNKISYNFKPMEVNFSGQRNTNLSKSENKNNDISNTDVDLNIPTTLNKNSKSFAVIIGNENYINEVKVPFAKNDAIVFSEYCIKTLGLPTENVHTLINGTFGQMLGEKKWICDVIRAYNGDAKIIIYYAGHGMPSEKDKSSFLLPVDGNSTITQTAIKLDDFYSDLSTFPTNSISVFLDACFSGAAREGSLLDGRGVRILPRESILTGNLVVFSATSADEIALPIKEYSHGLFTYFLLKKLQETKGDVTMMELSNYVSDNVKKQSIVVNNKIQNPRITFSPSLQDTWQLIKLR